MVDLLGDKLVDNLVDTQSSSQPAVRSFLVEPLRPEFATVVQVKRIKVKDATFANGKPNKLDDLDKLKKQANLLAELGFAQVFAFAMVVVDSRVRNKGEYCFEGLTPMLRDLIAESMTPNSLSSRVGMMHFEFVQPIDDVPLTSGTYSGKLVRMPQVARQSDRVTAWVAQAIAARDVEGRDA